MIQFYYIQKQWNPTFLLMSMLLSINREPKFVRSTFISVFTLLTRYQCYGEEYKQCRLKRIDVISYSWYTGYSRWIFAKKNHYLTLYVNDVYTGEDACSWAPYLEIEIDVYIFQHILISNADLLNIIIVWLMTTYSVNSCKKNLEYFFIYSIYLTKYFKQKYLLCKITICKIMEGILYVHPVWFTW